MSKEAMKLALKKAFQLGQDYWYQADHESYRQHKKSDETLAKFRQLVNETCEALAKPDFWEGYVPEPVKPAPPPECQTEAEKTAYAFGWWKALESQRALDKKAENARELGLDYEPAKDNSNYRFDPPGLDPSHQKPVAWWIPKAKQFCLPSSDGTRPFAKAWEPLYTSPPAQQEPVGRLESDPDEGHVFVPRIDGDWSMLGEDLYTFPPAQQEPVAWICEGSSSDEKHAIDYWSGDVDDLPIGTQLYAAPQRPWQGLTDEEVTWLCNTAKSHEQTWGMFVRTIEAKLKEKNNG